MQSAVEDVQKLLERFKNCCASVQVFSFECRTEPLCVRHRGDQLMGELLVLRLSTL